MTRSELLKIPADILENLKHTTKSFVYLLIGCVLRSVRYTRPSMRWPLASPKAKEKKDTSLMKCAQTEPQKCERQVSVHHEMLNLKQF